MTTKSTPTVVQEDEDTPKINWKELYKMSEENRMAKWKDAPPIVKEFYQEHPDVTSKCQTTSLCLS